MVQADICLVSAYQLISKSEDIYERLWLEFIFRAHRCHISYIFRIGVVKINQLSHFTANISLFPCRYRQTTSGKTNHLYQLYFTRQFSTIGAHFYFIWNFWHYYVCIDSLTVKFLCYTLCIFLSLNLLHFWSDNNCYQGCINNHIIGLLSFNFFSPSFLLTILQRSAIIFLF